MSSALQRRVAGPLFVTTSSVQLHHLNGTKIETILGLVQSMPRSRSGSQTPDPEDACTEGVLVTLCLHRLHSSSIATSASLHNPHTVHQYTF
eukprot:4237040-Amphidinium_carterae.2